jgi:hypothetical protein
MAGPCPIVMSRHKARSQSLSVGCLVHVRYLSFPLRSHVQSLHSLPIQLYHCLSLNKVRRRFLSFLAIAFGLLINYSIGFIILSAIRNAGRQIQPCMFQCHIFEFDCDVTKPRGYSGLAAPLKDSSKKYDNTVVTHLSSKTQNILARGTDVDVVGKYETMHGKASYEDCIQRPLSIE